jgi:hypothetical protein
MLHYRQRWTDHRSPFLPVSPKDYEFSATPCEIEAYDKHEVILLLPIKEWKASTG